MRIGNQTALAAADPMTPYHFALAHGFGAFEWFSDRKDDRGFSFGAVDGEARAQLRHEAQTRGVHFSVHAPWEADPWQHGDDAALRESVYFAADIGADSVVVHFNAEASPGAFVSALLPVARLARELDVRLALENTVLAEPRMFNALFAKSVIPSEVKAALGMCLDIGHANLCPATMYDYVGYLDQLGPHVPIIHVHLHENFGDRDSHLTLFTGPAGENDAGIAEVLHRLQRRGYHGSLILEQWPEPPELLVAARDRLCEMLSQTLSHH